MIFLATNKRDVTTDFVVRELRRRDLDFVRLNTEDFGSATVEFRPDRGWTVGVSGETVRLSEVTGAYYRRPGTPVAPSSLQPSVQDYVVSEWSAVLRSVWNALEGRWLNSPFSILRAEDKPRQLAEAHAVGLTIPETLVTNAIGPSVDFANAGPRIGKPLRHALIQDDAAGSVIFTSVLQSLGPEDAEALQLAPVILQRHVQKRRDLRVTIVGERLFAVAIESQRGPETEVDWRRGSRPDLPHEPVELPLDLAARLLQLTRRLDLNFAAVDLIEDRSGEFWFLEINPNGQWAWIERRTGLPIASAIVDLLAAP